MTERQLYKAIGELDEEMVLEAAKLPARKATATRWLAVAAALAVTAGAVTAAALLSRRQTPPAEPAIPTTAVTSATAASNSATTAATSLDTSVHTTTNCFPTGVAPVVTTPTDSFAPGGLPLLSGKNIITVGEGQGAGRVEYARSEEAVRGLLAGDHIPETMSAWRVGDAYTADGTLMIGILRRYAAMLGLDIPEEDITTSGGYVNDDYSLDAYVYADDYGCTVSSSQTEVYFYFSPARFEIGTDPAQWETRLKEVFPAVFAYMKEPTVSFGEGGVELVSREGQEGYFPEDMESAIHIYDAAEDCPQDLKGVWIQRNDWTGENPDKVGGVTFCLSEYYEKIAEYPIMGLQQAQEALKVNVAADEFTDVGENYRVVGAKLVYLPLSYSKLRVPLYCFYVTLPDDCYEVQNAKEAGLKAYQTFYVSAIPQEYWSQEVDLTWQR